MEQLGSPDKKSKQKTDYLLLLVIIIGYTSLVYYLSLMRYENFYTSNWDFGIARQLLWTGSHGYLLFETGDYTGGGIVSFLQVHSSYIALPLSHLYSLYPTASFLFLVQSGILATSVIPLYLIARETLSDRRLVFGSLLVYLFSFALISSVFYDFHWELFIPAEYLTLYYLISKKHYLISIIPFVLGMATLEVFPFLASGIFIYFAYLRFGRNILNPFALKERRDWLLLATFLLFSAISYILIRYLQFYVIPDLTNTTHTIKVTITSTGLVPRGLSPLSLATSLIYWIVLYFSLGFIPLFYKRHFVLLLPWLIGSVLIVPNLSSTFGNQYAALALPILAIGFIHGLSSLERKADKAPLVMVLFIDLMVVMIGSLFFHFSKFILNPSPPAGAIGLFILAVVTLDSLLLYVIWNKPNRNSSFSILKRLPKFNLKSALIFLLTGLLIFNIVVGPMNTQNFGITAGPGFQMSYMENPEFQYASLMSKQIPYNATVVASDNLFPMVANNPNAYSLLWFDFNSSILPFFPFNSTHLPKFLFIDSYQGLFVPNFIQAKINDSSYGVFAYTTFSGYPGDIYLLELNYYGTPIHYNVK